MYFLPMDPSKVLSLVKQPSVVFRVHMIAKIMAVSPAGCCPAADVLLPLLNLVLRAGLRR